MERLIKIMLNHQTTETKPNVRYYEKAQNFNSRKVSGNLCILGGPIAPNQHIQKHQLADYRDESHVKLRRSLRKKLVNYYSEKSQLNLEIKNLRLSQESPSAWKKTVGDTKISTFQKEEKQSNSLKRHSIHNSKRSESLSDKSYYLQVVPQITSPNRKEQDTISDPYYDTFTMHLIKDKCKVAKSPTVHRILNDPLPISNAADPGRKTHFVGKDVSKAFVNQNTNFEFQKRSTEFNSFKRPTRQTQNTFFPVTASDTATSISQQNYYFSQKLQPNKEELKKFSAESIRSNDFSAQKYSNKLRIKQTKVTPKILNPQISKAYASVKKFEDVSLPKTLSSTPLKHRNADASFETPLRQKMPNREISRQKLLDKNGSFLAPTNSSILEELVLKLKTGIKTNAKFTQQVLGGKRSSRDIATDQLYFNGQYRVPCKQFSSAKQDVTSLQINQEQTSSSLKPVIQKSAIKTSSRGHLNHHNGIFYPCDTDLSIQFKNTEATTQPKDLGPKGAEPPVMRRKYPLRRQVTMPKRLPSNQANMLLNDGENQSIITIEQMCDEEERYSDIQPSPPLPNNGQ